MKKLNDNDKVLIIRFLQDGIKSGLWDIDELIDKAKLKNIYTKLVDSARHSVD